MDPKDDLEQFITGVRLETNPEADARVLVKMLSVQGKPQEIDSAVNVPGFWRNIMKSRLIKYAAAAVIVIGVLVLVSILGGSPDGAGGAWAALADRIQKFQTIVYEVKSETGVTTGIHYYSDQYGIRADTLDGDDVHSSELFITEGAESLVLYHYLNKFILIEMDEESIQKEMQKADPRQWINDFMKEDYRNLGSSTINNIEVEGIEIEGHHLEKVLYEDCVIRLWVSLADQLPVRMEQEATALSGKFHSITIYDNFQWDAALDSSLFAPDITGYTEYPKPDIPSVSLENALEGLRIFAEKAGGKFPSSLARLTVMLEYKVTDDNVDEFARVMPLCLFYGNLVKNDKDVVYYGNLVTLGDTDKVLWRWQIVEDQYRIVFGDLHTITVDAKRLGELEGR